MRRHDHLVPSLLALALILTRLGMVARLADVFFYGEELEHATVAKAIVDDVPIPLHLLAYHAHEGGGVVAAHVTAAAFHFVGENVLALKLVAITFTLATLIVGYWAGTRLFGRPAGLLFGILFVASPEPIQRLSLLNLGWHPESSLFVLLVGGLWSIATRPDSDGRPRTGVFFALGLACGFGVYFNYQTIIAVVAAAFLLLCRWRTSMLGLPAAAALGGAVLGATPLTLMAVAGAPIFRIHDASVLTLRLSSPGQLATVDLLMRSLQAGVFSAITLTSIIVLMLCGMALAIRGLLEYAAHRTWSATRSAFSFPIIYLLLFAAAYELTGFSVTFTHWFALGRSYQAWAVATLLAAGAVAEQLRQPSRRLHIVSFAATGLLVLSGAVGTFRIIGEGTATSVVDGLRRVTHSKGYLYEEYFLRLVPRLPYTAVGTIRRLLAFDEPDPELLADAVAQAALFQSPVSDEEAIAMAEALPIALRRGFLTGIGGRIARESQGRPAPAIERAQLVTDQHQRPIVIEGIGGHFGYRWNPRVHVLLDVIESAQEDDLPSSFLVGVGRRVHARFYLDPRAALEFMTRIPEPARPFVEQGYRRAERLSLLGTSGDDWLDTPERGR